MFKFAFRNLLRGAFFSVYRMGTAGMVHLYSMLDFPKVRSAAATFNVPGQPRALHPVRIELLLPDAQKLLRLIIYRAVDNRGMGIFNVILSKLSFVDLVTAGKRLRYE